MATAADLMGLLTALDHIRQRERIEDGGPLCPYVPGTALDEVGGTLLIEAVTPLTLDVAMTVQQ